MFLRRVSKLTHPIYARRTFNQFLCTINVSNLELEAKAGNINSMAKLGIELVETDQHDKGLSFLEKAAESGHSEAQFHLATTLQKMFLEKQKGNKAQHKPGKAQTAQQVLNEIRKEQADARTNKKKRYSDKKKKDRNNEQGQVGQETKENTGTNIPEWKKMPEDMHVEYWLRQAVKNGHGKAMTSLGNYLISKSYLNEAEKHKGMRTALKLFNSAVSSQQLPDAAYNLGLLYYEGRGDAIEQNLVKSLQYFSTASNFGDVASSFWVGYCYAVGIGTEIHPAKALKYYQIAAEKGHPDAYYYIATLYREGCKSPNGKNSINADATTFIKYLRMAIDLDCGDAIYCLADLYWTGNNKLGIAKDLGQSLYFYRKAEALGHAEATLCLGAIYYNGSSLAKQDKRKAFDLYNKAAVNGSLAAWRNLASMYMKGDGVPQNKATAKHILKTMFNEDINGNQLPAVSESDPSASKEQKGKEANKKGKVPLKNNNDNQGGNSTTATTNTDANSTSTL